MHATLPSSEVGTLGEVCLVGGVSGGYVWGKMCRGEVAILKTIQKYNGNAGQKATKQFGET